MTATTATTHFTFCFDNGTRSEREVPASSKFESLTQKISHQLREGMQVFITSSDNRETSHHHLRNVTYFSLKPGTPFGRDLSESQKCTIVFTNNVPSKELWVDPNKDFRNSVSRAMTAGIWVHINNEQEHLFIDPAKINQVVFIG